ncbi:restriction endonuclease subunit S [Arthrobacter sp. SO3]|uniref:restriction endonuclease subunit S n=1 Tax=Arthrobacter sp. SO3 TaxID=1897057 RepID=UPI001CFFBA70|nr:restriction endonuclease subunit S [Arthrobacter sp. SO3]
MDLVQDGQISYGVVQPGNDSEAGVPIVRVKDVRNGTIDVSSPMRVDKEIAAKHSRTTLRGGELLLSLVGTVGESAVAPDNLAGWNVARAIAVIRPTKVSPRWLQLCFESMPVRSQILGVLNTTVQSTLNLADLKRLQMPVPPAEIRSGIEEVLGALDDKIAANTKLAQTSATLTQAGFTDALREADDGAVLSEITGLLSRGVTPKYSDGEDTVVVLNQKCIRDQRVNLDPARRTLISKVREDKLLMMDDVLVNSTGQGTLGRVARWTHGDSVTVDSHITIVRFDQAKVDPVCAGMALLSLQETIVEMGEGSTGQTELSRTELGKLRVRLPDRGRQAELGRRFTAMAEMERGHLRENQVLAATRDALLPQLMSGKLRVRDAEMVLEDAGV